MQIVRAIVQMQVMAWSQPGGELEGDSVPVVPGRGVVRHERLHLRHHGLHLRHVLSRERNVKN